MLPDLKYSSIFKNKRNMKQNVSTAPSKVRGNSAMDQRMLKFETIFPSIVNLISEKVVSNAPLYDLWILKSGVLLKITKQMSYKSVSTKLKSHTFLRSNLKATQCEIQWIRFRYRLMAYFLWTPRNFCK